MNHQEEKYERAKKRIEEERGFYSHLFIYVVINGLLQALYSGLIGDFDFINYMPWWVRFTTPGFWGISLFVHWIWIFKGYKIFGFLRDWEERKIQQFMEEEEDEYSNRFRKNDA